MSIFLLSMTLRWTTLTLHRIHHSEIICSMARRTILSQSALDRGLLYFLFTGFLSVFGRFLLFLDGSNPPRLVFPVPFCWTQGRGASSPSPSPTSSPSLSPSSSPLSPSITCHPCCHRSCHQSHRSIHHTPPLLPMPSPASSPSPS